MFTKIKSNNNSSSILHSSCVPRADDFPPFPLPKFCSSPNSPSIFFSSNAQSIFFTLSAITRWLIPGWRLGWIAASDPNGLLKKSGVSECIQKYLGMTSSPATLTQGALSEILSSTPTDFFDKVNDTMRESAEKCYQLANQIPCFTCPTKPQGCMFVMLKLDLSKVEGMEDELDFCCKLANEESLILLPGIWLGLKEWVRVTFAIEPSIIDDAFGRMEAFYKRHAKKQLKYANGGGV